MTAWPVLRTALAAAALALAGTAAPADLIECMVDGLPVAVSGPVAADLPEACRPLSAAAFPLGTDNRDGADLARRLDAQEAAIARLEREVERLRLLMIRPTVAQPAAPSIGGTLGQDSAGRLRDLGQDLDRKLDALADERRRLGR